MTAAQLIQEEIDSTEILIEGCVDTANAERKKLAECSDPDFAEILVHKIRDSEHRLECRVEFRNGLRRALKIVNRKQ
jgi:hypothetical protein